MTVLDTPLRSVSVRLINKFGKPVTLKYQSITPDSYDPAKRKPHTSDVTKTVKAIIEPVGLVGAPGSGQRDNTLTSDLNLTIAAQGLPAAPKAKDAVTIDGLDYEVDKVDPIYSGELVAIYQMHVGR